MSFPCPPNIFMRSDHLKGQYQLRREDQNPRNSTKNGIFQIRRRIYIDSYNKLKEFGGAVVRYFESNWHPIRSEWVEAYKKQTLNFGIRTNNRIESFFQKVKSLVTTRTSLKDLVEKLFVLISLQPAASRKIA